MSGKIIEVSCAAAHQQTLQLSAQDGGAKILSSQLLAPELERISMRLWVDNGNVQTTMDAIQKLLPKEAEPFILLLPVDANIGASSYLVRSGTEQDLATREELFNEITKSTELNTEFLIMAFLATVVATIGIAEDNIAVVIGAMVIAPLLGPNLGLALGGALGDVELTKSAILTNIVGITLTVLTAALLAFAWPPNMQSHELLSRTEVRPASLVLALAAGIAAALSLTTRLKNALVGVMVAVALVPPATVFGMMLGIGNWSLASGAGLLLLVNVAAVNITAQLVFVVQGIRPRTWLAQREAKEDIRINLILWTVLLALCSFAIYRLA